MKKILVLMIMGVLLLSSCMSIMISMAKTYNKDYGVLDNSVPNDQQCEIRFAGIKITSFNGKPVNLGSANVSSQRSIAANDYSGGHIKVPSGINTIIFDFIQVQEEQTGWRDMGNSVEYRYTTTTTSAKDITYPNIEMLPGHNYFISAEIGSNGKINTWFFDTTNWPQGFLGDNVSKPPKKSKTPTVFEGKWAGGERGRMVIYTFKGNTWESDISPHTWTNAMSPGVVSCRGTFKAENGILTMYVTHRLGLWWMDFTAAKEAFIFNYSIEGNNMVLEWPWIAPKMRFQRVE